MKNIYTNKIKEFGVYFDDDKSNIFEHHINELIKRIEENLDLNIDFEDWMLDQVSEESMNLSKKFLNKFFPKVKFKKIEIFLIATHIELEKGDKNE